MSVEMSTVVESTDQQVDERVDGSPTTVNSVLGELLRYEEILGVVAVSVEGLVIGSAGVGEEDADFLSVLGSSLAGVAERSTRRLGVGSAVSLSITAQDGMVSVHNAGSFALTILSEQTTDPNLVTAAAQSAMAQVDGILSPI